MHLMAMHVPYQVELLKGIKRFSGQRKYSIHQNSLTYTCTHIHVCTSLQTDLLLIHIAVEKNNDEARKHYNSSNRLDGGHEIVLADARMEQLQHEKRKYKKTNDEYWTSGLVEKRRRCTEQMDD